MLTFHASDAQHSHGALLDPKVVHPHSKRCFRMEKEVMQENFSSSCLQQCVTMPAECDAHHSLQLLLCCLVLLCDQAEMSGWTKLQRKTCDCTLVFAACAMHSSLVAVSVAVVAVFAKTERCQEVANQKLCIPFDAGYNIHDEEQQ